jgi:lipid-binding SYLF domain-containing protein
VTLRAEMLTYSRSRGLFAGISLEGSTLRPDNNANESIYHRKVNATDVVRKGGVAIPPAAQKMVSLLDQHSPKNTSDPQSLK